MLAKKKEDRIKSAQSTSPYHKKFKEGTFAGGMNNDGKQAKIVIWPEWSETDVNNEKWEIPTKAKEKDKAKSPQMIQNLFEDPDGQLKLPPSLKPIKWKRANEYFIKNPVIVDSEIGVHKFDIFTLNEHLFVSETMRWIICQISNLWISSEKKYTAESSENQIQEFGIANSNGIYHTWKFWEHIYSLNKVGKGFPQYNPAGKYIVKLFWMGEWRKILVDDNLPFDENDKLLLPVTTINNELWSVILCKALLKVASLSYDFASNETEFGDFSVIHSLTGWIPQKKIVSKEYQNVTVNYLSNLLNHWTYPSDKCNLSADKKDDNNLIDFQNTEINLDKSESKEIPIKDKNKKDIKENKQKEKKEKDKNKSEKLLDGKTSNENPEILILASYNSSFNQLKMLSSSKMASRCEALRKIGMPLSYSHPVILNYYRDSPLEKEISPELIPSWKLIRPLIKMDLPRANDCTTHNKCDSKKSATKKDELQQFIEIQSPFINSLLSLKKYSTTEQINENQEENIKIISNSNSLNTKSNKENIDSEVTIDSSNNNFGNFNSNLQRSGEIANLDGNLILRNEDKYDFSKGMMKSWIDIETFFDCFEVIYIYHKTETYRYTENLMDFKTSNNDQKEPFYLFTDNIDNTEIIFCLSVFCKWFTSNDISYLPDSANNRRSSSINIMKDPLNNLETNNEESENFAIDPIKGTFFAENHNWNNFKVGKCIKRSKTNGTKAVSLKFPPGRHCLRIFIQAVNGFHCKLISQNQFSFGTEDEIMPLAVECPKRILNFGIDIISSFKNIIVNFSNEERQLSESTFNKLILDFNKDYQFKALTSEFTQVFSQGLLKTFEKFNKEILTSDMMFALRALNLDFQSFITLNTSNKQNANSNRNSAKVPPVNSKVDNRKQSSTKSLINGEIKERKNEFVEDYSSFNILNIIQLQKLIKGYYVRKIITARNPQSLIHDRVVNELGKIKTLIEQHTSEIGINILNEIVEMYPQILKHCGLDKDKLNHINLQEYKGNGNLQPSNGFGILFREIFHINPLAKNTDDILIKLNCNVQKCKLSVINNDNGDKLTENILKRLHLKSFLPNNSGYTLIATVKDVENAVMWKLKIICGANSCLPIFTKQDLCNEFSISKIREYYVPEESGLLFHQVIKIKLDHLISVFVKLSNPNVSLRLSIFNNDEELCFIEGIGEACIESFLLVKDQFVDEQVDLVRSGSKNSTKLKKGQEKSERYSAKNSRTNSSSSIEDNKIYKYSIRASVNPFMWSLTQENEEFIEKFKVLKRNNMNESKVWNDGPNKSTQNFESIKKENAQKVQPKTKLKEKNQDAVKNSKNIEKPITKNNPIESSSRPNSTYFEFDKQHWTVLIFSDISLEENIQIYKNNEKFNTLCSIKRIWLEMDPLRFEKGKQIQMKYNEENNAANPNDRNVSQKSLDLSVFYPINLTKNVENLSQSRYNFIDISRQHNTEWNLWCIEEKNSRIKKIKDSLNNYHNQQKNVNFHRLTYFKNREKIKHA